jgi:DNA polymerase-1
VLFFRGFLLPRSIVLTIVDFAAQYAPCRLIVDLNHLAYRNWAANDGLATSKGELTGAIYGTLKSLIALSEQFRPVQIVGVRDSSAPFRRNIYPAYKANRLRENSTPEEIRGREIFDDQLGKLERVLAGLGVPVLGIEELEADDLAALVAHGIPFSGTTVLVSGDRDYVQLVRPGIALLSPMLRNHGKLLLSEGPEHEEASEEEWKRLFEVGPRTFIKFVEKLPRGMGLDRWLLYRALVGDSSDNLPGVHSIGPAAALKIVERFYSLAGLKEGSENDWKAVMNSRQREALERAIANRDLDKQYRIIDLSSLPQTEGAAELIAYLKLLLGKREPDERAVRSALVRWEMSSLLLNWQKLLRAFPAFSA